MTDVTKDKVIALTWTVTQKDDKDIPDEDKPKITDKTLYTTTVTTATGDVMTHTVKQYDGKWYAEGLFLPTEQSAATADGAKTLLTQYYQQQADELAIRDPAYIAWALEQYRKAKG